MRNVYVHRLYKEADKYNVRQKETSDLAETGRELTDILYAEVKRHCRWQKAGKLDRVSALCKTSGCEPNKEMEAAI